MTAKEILSKLDSLTTLVTALAEKVEILSAKAIENEVHAEKTRATVQKFVKEQRKAKKSETKRKNSGFHKPVDVSPSMSEFLKLKPGDKISRVDVTRAINKYIFDNDLKDKTNGRNINLDTTLKTLLKPKDGEVVTWFRMQQLLGPMIGTQALATAQ
jgi:chromatin remodeling complex protein RSC6